MEYVSCTTKKTQLFNLVIQVQGHSDLIVIYNTLPGHNTYINKKNGTEQKYCHGKWHTCMIKKITYLALRQKIFCTIQDCIYRQTTH
jgi:hypothetical protein